MKAFAILFPTALALLAWQGRGAACPSPQEPRPVEPRGALTQEEQSTIALFEKASPAVVHIRTTEVIRSPFSFQIREEFTGTGSGFLWDAEGTIVTNFHVIKDASRAFVTLADGTSLEAALIGAEPLKDIAVLKIDPPESPLPVIPLGTSSDLKVGQNVYAIGNPFGLDHTLSTGIISGLDREIIGIAGNRIRQVIQIDAAINPGNSGGPLLDSAGRLIGMNTAIKSPNGASAGIGFAVPVDTMRRVVTALIRDGEVPHAALGLSVLPSRWSRARGIPGLVISDVEPQSAAAAAGLQPARQSRRGRIALGDLLLALDGAPLHSEEELALALASFDPGDKVRLTINREGKELEVWVTLGSE